MRAMHWVLVTGAGASTALGHPGHALPLMADWAAELRAELERKQPNLADAAGLTAGIDAQTFEETLSTLLQWRDLRPLNERFEGLGGPDPGNVPQGVKNHRRLEETRLTIVLEAINSTLFRLFNQAVIDVHAAKGAYDDLLRQLNFPPRITVATTNYDLSAELGLEALKRRCETGLVSRAGRPPLLQAEGLVARTRSDENVVAVLHLHGAVGWYEREDVIEARYSEQPFDEALGRPVVLYPDPNDDPTEDGPVQALWREFELALDEADGVLVLGHALRDPTLVAKLDGLDAQVPLGVSTYGIEDAGPGELVADPMEVQRLEGLFSRGCDVIALRFGDPLSDDMLGLDRWLNDQRGR